MFVLVVLVVTLPIDGSSDDVCWRMLVAPTVNIAVDVAVNAAVAADVAVVGGGAIDSCGCGGS